MKMPFADDFGAVNGPGPESVGHHIVGVEAQKEVGIDGVVVDLFALLLVESREIVGAAAAIEAHGLSVAAESHRTADVGRLRKRVVRAEIVGQTIQTRVKHRAVQAFVVVDDDELPIGLHFINDALVHLEILHAPGSEFLGQVGELRGGRAGLRGEVDEDVAVPHSRRNFVQWIVFTAKIGFLHVWSADERTVQRIGPAVIGTLDASGKCALGGSAQARAAMAAHIIESADLAARIAGDDNALAGDVAQEVVAGPRNLTGAAGANPGLAIKALELFAENVRVGVIAPGKSRRAACRLGGHSALPGMTFAMAYYATRARRFCARKSRRIAHQPRVLLRKPESVRAWGAAFPRGRSG